MTGWPSREHWGSPLICFFLLEAGWIGRLRPWKTTDEKCHYSLVICSRREFRNSSLLVEDPGFRLWRGWLEITGTAQGVHDLLKCGVRQPLNGALGRKNRTKKMQIRGDFEKTVLLHGHLLIESEREIWVIPRRLASGRRYSTRSRRYCGIIEVCNASSSMRGTSQKATTSCSWCPWLTLRDVT